MLFRSNNGGDTATTSGLSTTELFLLGKAAPNLVTNDQSDDDIEIVEDEVQPVVRGRGRGRPRGRVRAAGQNVRGSQGQQVTYGPSPASVRNVYSPGVRPIAASTPTRAIRGQRPMLRGRGQPPRPVQSQQGTRLRPMHQQGSRPVFYQQQPVIRSPAPDRKSTRLNSSHSSVSRMPSSA